MDARVLEGRGTLTFAEPASGPVDLDTRTLSDEYSRDAQARPHDARVPENYFPSDNPAKTPANTWRAHGHLLIFNWINEMYQNSPFNLAEIGRPTPVNGGA